jgi:hypothetical protein
MMPEFSHDFQKISNSARMFCIMKISRKKTSFFESIGNQVAKPCPLNSGHGIEQSNIGRDQSRTLGLVAVMVASPVTEPAGPFRQPGPGGCGGAFFGSDCQRVLVPAGRRN